MWVPPRRRCTRWRRGATRRWSRWYGVTTAAGSTFRTHRVPSPEELASERYLRHLGVYAYTRDALARWVALPGGALEQIEKLEQLRALAAGLSIGVGVVDSAEGGIDTIEDARRAEARLMALART